ncbi:MAG: hypothetical protein AB7F86_06085 [Bdellovibrionales bacterium]
MRKIWIPIIAVGFVTALFFQNCGQSESRNGQALSGRFLNSGNGFPYEGKLYATNQDLCPDGSPAARIKLMTAKSGLMVRGNCQDLNPAPEINPNLLIWDYRSPEELMYDSIHYVAE